MEEGPHIASVLNEAKKALISEDALKLNELSNQTIHCSTCFQDSGPIAMAVIIYSLSKLIERGYQTKLKTWTTIKNKIAGYFRLAEEAVKQDNQKAFENHILSARSILTSQAINIKPFIEEVIKKAAVNKAGKIYEHGISLGQTAQLLGITQWELNEYTGQSKSADIPYMKTLNVRDRAKMALEFLS